MKSFSTFAPFCVLSLQLQPALAFWRMACSVSQTSRIDPILSPGTISGHVHKFAGGNNVDQSSTHETLQSSTCSTCEVQSDKSAYWTPQLYYEYSDGTIEEVQNDGMTVYYVGRGGTSSNTVPFPQGFKMITGNSLLRHYDTQNLTYMDTRPIADRTHYINDTNCVNGLRAQVNFQSCWDGVNLYKEGNTHVAYLSGIDYGVCPPTHPVPIPGLFYEVLYWSNRIDQSKGGRFVFSNGDTTGYGFHGDFLNGWDQNVQAQAVQDCLYNSGDSDGVVSACSALASSDNVNFARTCPESAEVMPEAIKGTLPSDQLPGCNPISSGPADATQVICALNSTTPITGQTSSSSQSVIASTTLISSATSVPITSSTALVTTDSTSTDSSASTDTTATSLSSTSSSSSDESTSSASSVSVTDSTTGLTTAPTTATTSASIETLTTVTTYTWTRSGHPWNSQSFSEFTRSYTGFNGAPQSVGGVFVTASSSQSSDPASGTSSCATIDTVTTTVTVTVGGSGTNVDTTTSLSTITSSATPTSSTVSENSTAITDATTTNSPASESSDTFELALSTVTTTETVTVNATGTVTSEVSLTSTESSSISPPLTVTTATDGITTTAATGPETTTSLSSMPWSAYLSHRPVHSSWYNFSAPWSNFSHHTGYPPTATTMFTSSAPSLTSSVPVNQSSSVEASQSTLSSLDQTSATVTTDTSIPASSTAFYTGTSTNGTMTTLVTVFVPVSADITSAPNVTPTTASTTVTESSLLAFRKREAENQRLKALVTFRLKGREVIMEKSE